MNIALLGYGKMGKSIDQLIDEYNLTHKDSIHVVLKIDSATKSKLTKENLQSVDVAIEFSTPTSALQNIYLCLDADVPIVVGTTGWLDHLQEVKETCIQKNGALLYAANFSIGVNIFFELNKKLTQLMAHQHDYSISIQEIHHTEKKDAPSGTALKLAEQIIAENHLKKTWVNHSTEKISELEILSLREADVPGTHEVSYTSFGDSIQIKHTAFSRQGFAQGALHAALWLQNKKGVFTMQDLLSI